MCLFNIEIKALSALNAQNKVNNLIDKVTSNKDFRLCFFTHYKVPTFRLSFDDNSYCDFELKGGKAIKTDLYEMTGVEFYLLINDAGLFADFN